MTQPTLMWFRRDLRLGDHAALTAACADGPVIPVFIWDKGCDQLGAAPKWRLGLALEHLADRLKAMGSRLILRRGGALSQLQELITETGAGQVFWSRLYDPDSVARDTDVKSTLKEAGVTARSFAGHLLFEPWSVETKTGGPYRVYSPFWRAVKDRQVEASLPEPGKIPAPDTWPTSDDLAETNFGDAMRRGVAIVRPHVQLGEAAARDRLDHFIEDIVADYVEDRNRPDKDGTSNMSENLALGEISPHICWHAGMRAMQQRKKGAEHFLKEIVWREFAYHLMHHTPRILTDNWKEDWDAFPWRTDPDHPHVKAWQQGRTGVRFVDAAMRELYVTGRMHNRARMIVASYLTKHLMTDWKIGLKWFEDTLIDWDPASNAMGWQWTAGSGPDASPYFRVFNPDTQLEKFDPIGAYANKWIAQGLANPHEDGLAYYDAIPKSWGLSVSDPYPEPIVSLKEGRDAALNAYQSRGF